MFKGKTKELLICIIAVLALVFVLATHVFAMEEDITSLLRNSSDGEEDIPEETDGLNALDDLDDDLDDDYNTNVNNSVENTVNNTTNTNNNTNTNTTKYPDTGVDYSIVFVIVVCGISTVYAYKKIKDYNNL